MLNADTAVNALVAGRIAPLVTAQGLTDPRIVVERISTERWGTADGPSLLAQARIQVTVYDGRKGVRTYNSVVAIADAVRKVLDGYRGESAGVKCGGIMLIDERDQPVPAVDGGEKPTAGRSMDFLCFYVEGPRTITLSIPIAAGANDAYLDAVGPTWNASTTTLLVDSARTAFLQFLVPLIRGTPIVSATLRLTPSATNSTVPATFTANYVELFDDDLSVDRSALLADLDAANETESIASSWTANAAVDLDVTNTVETWLARSEVPLDGSGALLTLTLQKLPLNLYHFYAFEHATGAAAELIIEYVAPPL